MKELPNRREIHERLVEDHQINRQKHYQYAFYLRFRKLNSASNEKIPVRFVHNYGSF